MCICAELRGDCCLGLWLWMECIVTKVDECTSSDMDGEVGRVKCKVKSLNRKACMYVTGIYICV